MGILSTYKIPQPKRYDTTKYYVEDTSTNSLNYFNIESFPLVVGGGRHTIKLKGNGLGLKLRSSIDLEIKDSAGKNVFCEVVNFVDRFNNYYISFDIYDITAQGVATAYFVGEAVVDLQGRPIPESEKGQYNVRWTKRFNILPFERNNADLIFDEPPKIAVAQVVIPTTVGTTSTGSAHNYSIISSSLLTINTSNFAGYDRDFASSPDILDPRLKAIKINPQGESMTMNSVPTAVRMKDSDIQNGDMINYTTRFNTIATSTSSFFKKEHLGGYFEFVNSGSTPRRLLPALPPGITASENVADQLSRYNSTIVEIVNDRQAVLSKPLEINTINNNSLSRNQASTFSYKLATTFSASIAYVPTVTTFVTSSTVSQSYVEFTFSDINPISGQIYRIKTSMKTGASTGDYKLLNDQVVSPVEYLTDAAYKNGVNYARHESDYRMIGHFTTQTILDTYWFIYQEDASGFDIITGSISNNPLIEAVGLRASGSQSRVLTTKYNQNYNADQVYTIGLYLTLDPYTELEVYMNSDPLNTHLTVPQVYPRGFNRSINNEKQRYSEAQNRFGKYIGKISNDRPTRKYYGKVIFDFETDGSGYGQPVFRSRVIDEMSNISGSAYLSEVSIKPYTLNGFTPKIIQYAVPLPTEFTNTAQLSQSLDFKIDYFDYTGTQSEYATFLDDVVLNLKAEIPSNTCQTDKVFFTYDPGRYAQNIFFPFP